MFIFGGNILLLLLLDKRVDGRSLLSTVCIGVILGLETIQILQPNYY